MSISQSRVNGELDSDVAYNPTFLEQVKDWVDGPPVIEQLEVVGSYNLF